jgi:hypothetical protein
MRALVRVALSIGAITALWFAEMRSLHFSFAHREATVPSLWLSWLGLVVLAGVLFGLALTLPKSWSGFRWGATLAVAALPALLLTYFVFLYGVWIPSHAPYSINRAFLLWGNLQTLADHAPQFALALIVGVALGTGFREERKKAAPSEPDNGTTPELDREETRGRLITSKS